MLKRNHVSVLAMLASFSLLPFTSCSDDAGSNPVPVATESSSSVAISSSESSSSEAVSRPKSSTSSGTSVYQVEDLPECKADNENVVDSVQVGPSEWTYYECKQGSWNESLSQRALRILPTCSTEREGAIDSMQVQLSDSASYYRNNYYFKCEQGIWIDLNHAAPLAAAVQAQCEENHNSVSLASYDDVQTDYWCGDLVLGAGGDPRLLDGLKKNVMLQMKEK